jgi:DNA-binding transcriptional regulator YiaG
VVESAPQMRKGHFVQTSLNELAAAVQEARGNDSLPAFAHAAMCSVDSVKRWEAGTSRPRSEAHIRFLEARGVPSELLRVKRPTKAATEAAA